MRMLGSALLLIYIGFVCVFPSENITGVPTFHYCRLFPAHASLIVIPGNGLIIVSSPSDPLSVPL